MELPQDLVGLLPRKHTGKPLTPRATLQETQRLWENFEDRSISYAGIGRALGHNKTVIRAWFKQGIPADKLPLVRELMDKIKNWEAKSGKRFPG